MPTPSKRLVALVGTAATGLLLAYVPAFEGVVLRGYEDPIGVVSACAGHTATAALGRAYTPEQCEALLQDDLERHAAGVLACTPSLEGRTFQLAAAVSLAYNVGVGAYCSSTMAARFRAGRWADGCAELSRWIYAGGKQLPGLVKRRAAERALCEVGL